MSEGRNGWFRRTTVGRDASGQQKVGQWDAGRRDTQGAADLLVYVVQGIGRVDGEADQDDVRIGVRERAEAVVILLTGGIPQRQLDMLAIDLDVGDVVLEDGRDVDLQDWNMSEQ